jgi:5-methyltetrahydropteroyltriglutamate--homocysteine methyltransferase
VGDGSRRVRVARLAAVKRSTERILTTHTGSLPRPWDLVTTLESLDAGTLPDRAAFEARVRQAVAEAVRKQVAAGVDLINDGEQGKVGYSTYVRHRLSGFEGSSVVAQRADWADFPEALARHPRSSVSRPSCTGPIEWRDREAVARDVANLQAGLSGVKATEAFMTAASPGVIAHFLRNEHYPSREAYLARLTDVMRACRQSEPTTVKPDARAAVASAASCVAITRSWPWLSRHRAAVAR